MRSLNKYIYLKPIIIAAFVLFSGNLFAQATPCDPGQGPDAPPVDCPIDSGVVLLITAAVAIAAKKTYDIKKSLTVSI